MDGWMDGESTTGSWLLAYSSTRHHSASYVNFQLQLTNDHHHNDDDGNDNDDDDGNDNDDDDDGNDNDDRDRLSPQIQNIVLLKLEPKRNENINWRCEIISRWMNE